MSTQPDKLKKLDHDNEYDIISLKRTHVTVEAKRLDESARLRILIDHRAKMTTITRLDGWAMPRDLYAALVRHVGLKMGVNLSEALMRPASHLDSDEIRFSCREPDHLFGIIHRIKETKGWDSESTTQPLS